MSKEIPILFSTPMVQAILDGRKTQTRRTTGLDHINKNPDDWQFVGKSPEHDVPFPVGKGRPHLPWYQFSGISNNSNTFIAQCPYGQPGDVLWVREVHYRFGHWEKNGFTKSGKQKWRFVPVPGSDIYYEGDELPEEAYKSRQKGREEFNVLYKRLARFMPKEAARMWLRVKSEGVERLHDISESDAIAEGVDRSWTVTRNPGIEYKNYFPENKGGSGFAIARWSFASLWQSIYGEESWDSNPWVWVVEFERIDKPAI